MPRLQRSLRLVRAEDLLVLEVELTNLDLSEDGQRLERIEPGSPAILTLHLPSQHVAEQAYLESENSKVPADPPPIGALAAGPTRLSFTLPDGQGSIAFTLEALLDWSSLVPRLAPNALPPDTDDGPAPAIPAADQTAIEFPYRLLLSPDAGGRWIHRHMPFTAANRTELWHTRLSADRSPVPVRAIGRRPVADTLRTSLSDRDLNDIITLSSDFSVRPKSAAEMGLPARMWLKLITAAGLRKGSKIYQYTPVPLDADELMLTALGASARLRGGWTYPEPDQDIAALQSFGMPTPSLEQYEHIAGLGRDQYVRVVRRGLVHTGMRASIVKVTERRFEPRQLATEQAPGGPAVFGGTAYLRQYFKIVIQEPEIDYGALAGGYEAGGREMPLRSLRLTTLETPKIDLPASPDALEQHARQVYIVTHPFEPVDELVVARDAQRLLEASLLEPFWITVDNREFEFGFVATDWEKHAISGSIPLLFIPYEVITQIVRDPSKITQVKMKFSAGTETRRTRPLHNQKIALADRTGSEPNSTCASVETLTFALQDVPPERQTALPAHYLPRWVMAVSGARVHLEALARLTGNDQPVAITFDPVYLMNGLAADRNPAGVFARFNEPVKVSFQGARGGGLARPDAPVDRLSSRQGALASVFLGTPHPGRDAPEVQLADLAALFGTDAKIFGTFDLKDILAEIGPPTPDHFSKADLPEAVLEDLLTDHTRHVEVPVLRTRPLVRGGFPYAIESRFVWKPLLNTAASGKLFIFDATSEFVLDSRMVTPLDGSAQTSTVCGELRRFGLGFFGVVTVRMELLRFITLPGRKPDVTAEGLDLTFDGPLQFVNTLKNILPANGFSDPPAIEVTPEGIRAGYSLGIPSVGVGIFALQNLALSAALSVPFFGKPAGVRFAISERHHPFLVTVTLFGGGGFFALGISAKGVDEIEAAIEFGGNFSLNLGVASGGVHIMAGIYFGRTGDTAVLTGYLRCGGHLSVLGLISLSIEFYLAFTYRDKGGGHSEVWGQASLTVCVKLVCFSKSVSLSIERRFAGASGDPTLDQVFELPDWATYCLAFAAEEPT